LCYPYGLIELAEYLDERGRSALGRWKASLDGVTRACVDKAIFRLGQGNLSSLKGVGDGVLEMRLDFGPGVRVYVARDGETLIILLGGGTKHRQEEDIETAKIRWKHYKERKRIDEPTDTPVL